MISAIVHGWLDDVHTEKAATQGTPASANIDTASPPNTPSSSFRKRSTSLNSQANQQKRRKRNPIHVYSMEHDPEPEPGLRRSRDETVENAYTASINAAPASGSIPSLTRLLTSATTLSQSTTSSWTGSRGRKRSRSPAKTVQDLENANPPTAYLQVQHPGKDLPLYVRNLHNEIVRASKRGKGIFPQSIKACPFRRSCSLNLTDLL
jgi:hypothetical protein